MTFSPNKSITPSVLLEKRSIQYIENLLLNTDANPYLSENDKTPNYDGYIELLNGELICGKITVQVKTYPDKYKEAGKFDIPTSLLGYSQSVPTEVVLLLVVDTCQGIIYWKHISKEFIDENRTKANQKTITYKFLGQENLSFNNRIDVVNLWKQIYHNSASNFIDKKQRIGELIDAYACAFEAVNSYFYSLPDSYVKRSEFQELMAWIKKDFIVDKNDNICVLTGNAGVGKSVLIKQLSNKLRNDGIRLFAIKADMQIITSEDALNSVYEVLNFITADKKERVVLLIDQIDALSQSLSSDRAQINAYFSLLNKFSTSLYSNLRIVVSCRQFDLDYDPILNNLKDKTNIKLDKLKVEDVKNVLLKLVGEDNIEKISDHTIQLLQTAQYLDTYCRIYKISQIVSDFPSQIKLYEELWNLKVLHPTLATVLSSDLEMLLFKIAKKIHVEQSLSIKWKPSGADIKCVDYLLTEGLITSENSQIRFFHQSFYDFVFSKNFIQENTSLYSFVLDNHQGFFVRSSIKQALDYLRDNDSENYINQIHLLLEDNHIRFHIKLLVLQFLAFQKPVRGEVALMLKLLEADRELFNIFLKQNLTVEWFDNIIGKLQYEIIDIEDFERNIILVNYFCSCSKYRDKRVFSIIDRCKNDDIKRGLALRSLWFTANCNNQLVRIWYFELYKINNDYDKLFFLEKAVEINPEFVCAEVQKILTEALGNWVKNEQYLIDNHYLFETIIAILVKDHPFVIYPVIKQIVIKLVESTAYSISDEYLYWDAAFYSFYYEHSETYMKLKESIVLILKSLLKTNERFVVDEIIFFLSIKSRTLYTVALEIMVESPHLFDRYIYKMLQDHQLTEYMLGDYKEGYYFKLLLKLSYQNFNSEQVLWVQEYALSFRSDSEMIPMKIRYSRDSPIYPYIGLRQRALIYSIPDYALTNDLKRKRDELDRRFKDKYENKLSSDDDVSAYICGGLVSDEKYVRFSFNSWEASFLKIKNDDIFRSHLDLRVHQDKFRECVKNDAKRFYRFVIKIINSPVVPLNYKLVGLHGLVQANYKADAIFDLFKQMYGKIDVSQCNLIIDILQSYLKNKSMYREEIYLMLVSIISINYNSNYQREHEYRMHNWNKNVPELLTRGINTIQGRAIIVLIEYAKDEKYRQQVYNTFIGLDEFLAVELKLLVLSNLFNSKTFDEYLFEKLVKIYLVFGVSEFIPVCGNMINKYLFSKPELVIPYLSSVMSLPKAQDGLGILCFLGYCYGNKSCESILEHKINNKEFDFIKGAVDSAFVNLSNPLCNKQALFVLDKVFDLSNEQIHQLLSNKLYRVSSNDFYDVKNIIEKYIIRMNIKPLKGIDHYLKKCCAEYPEECYVLLDQMLRTEKGLVNANISNEYLDILFSIYKYLNGDSDIQNKILDTFDYVFRNFQGPTRINEMISKLDDYK